MAANGEVNILLITLDQLRADSLGCSGHALVRTPTIDALAARGVRFARHFNQATPCGPSRNSLHTGMYMMNHRGVQNGARPTHPPALSAASAPRARACC